MSKFRGGGRIAKTHQRLMNSKKRASDIDICKTVVVFAYLVSIITIYAIGIGL